MKLNPLLLTLSIFMLKGACSGQLTTWINSGSTNISAGQLAQIISMKIGGGTSIGYVSISKGTNVTTIVASDFKYGASDGANWPWPITISGPANISLIPPNGGTCFLTLKISDNATDVTPSTAVVIPTDATGPVNIILESSADLVNWTAALPGTYGASTTNRFFRVRAVRQ